MTADERTAMSRDLEIGLAQMEQIKGQMEALRGQTASLQSILMDYTNSLDVIAEMDGSEETDILMPIGGSAFLKVKVVDNKKCLVDRGAGVFMDTDLSEAKELVQQRMGSIRGGIGNIENTINELMRSYDERSKKAEELYAKQMAAGAGADQTF